MLDVAGVETAESVHENHENEYAPLGIEDLRLGVRLKLPIHDERMVLLLSEGQVINESFLKSLRNRALNRVRVHMSEVPRIQAGKPQGTAREVPPSHATPVCPDRNQWTDEFDEWVGDPAAVGLPPQGEAFQSRIIRRGAVAIDESKKHEFVERQHAAVGQIDRVFDNLLRGNGMDFEGLTAITDEALSDLENDMDLFVNLGINPHHCGYPARHSMHTCMLAIAIGSHLKLDRPTLKELGVGCLIHDSGMLMIDQRLAASPRRLRSFEMLEISKHPVRIFDKMLSMSDVSKRSGFIAYQMHERTDGSGYPRRRKKDQIHFLSRVAAVADVYVALAAPRPYRPGMLPHKALQLVLQLAGDGKVDRSAVQALLRTLSAYPIGSYVQLSDGRVGTVIRSNDMQFERPVVEAWSRHALHLPPAIVDLSLEEDLRILGPLPSITAPFEPERKDAEDARGLIDRVNSNSQPAKTQPAEPVSRTVVSVYVPVMGQSRDQLNWHRLAAVSNDLRASGMSLFARDEIRSPLVLVAFNARAGIRLCQKVSIDQRELLSDHVWKYDVTFRGESLEPSEV